MGIEDIVIVAVAVDAVERLIRPNKGAQSGIWHRRSQEKIKGWCCCRCRGACRGICDGNRPLNLRSFVEQQQGKKGTERVEDCNGERADFMGLIQTPSDEEKQDEEEEREGEGEG